MSIFENGRKAAEPMAARTQSWRGGCGTDTATMCRPLPEAGRPSVYGPGKIIAVIPDMGKDATKYGQDIRNVLGWLFKRNIPTGPVAVLFEDQDGTGGRIFIELSTEAETDGSLVAWPEKTSAVIRPKPGDGALAGFLSALSDYIQENRNRAA